MAMVAALESLIARSRPVAPRASRIADIAASVPSDTSQIRSTDGTMSAIRSARGPRPRWERRTTCHGKRPRRRRPRSPLRPWPNRTPTTGTGRRSGCRRRPRGRRPSPRAAKRACRRPRRAPPSWASSARRGSFASRARTARRMHSQAGQCMAVVGFGLMTVGPEDVRAAAERISGRIRRSDAGPRARRCRNASVVAKLEFLQHTGSFKPRGAFNKLLSSEVPPAGVIAASGRNFGSAVAYAAREIGVPAGVHPVDVTGDEGGARPWVRRPGHDRRGVLGRGAGRCRGETG